MSTNKVYREIVQDGLDRRAAREAALEAQARKLRIIINDNHIAKTGNKVAQHSECRQEEAKAKAKAKAEHLKRKQEARAKRAAEAAYCTDWYGFMIRLFAPLFIAAATLGLCNNGVLPIILAGPCAIVACMISVEIFAHRIIPRECNAE